MSNEPILLFLHGVGTGDPDDHWLDPLSTTLERLGYSELDKVKVIAPKYAHALKGWDSKEALPGVRFKPLTRELAQKNRRDFERRTSAIEFRLGRHNGGNALPGGGVIIDTALGLPSFKQAHNYLNDRQIRAQVLNLILAQLPESGRMVIVGHSLGSVIAADLVSRLPIGLEISGMVTIGSPLAHGSFNLDNLQATLKEPPSNLAWWANFWTLLDPVSSHRGVSSAFPWMLDYRIQNPINHHVHDAVEYLADETVGKAIGFALLGSNSKELTHSEKGLDIPLDAAEHVTLLSLRYAHLVKMRLEGDIQDRYAGALRQVQATAISEIKARNQSENRTTPSQIARLSFDFADPQAAVPAPLPSRHLTKEEGVLLLIVLASENIIRPFEIAIPTSKRQDPMQGAMEEFAAELGLGSQFGAQVFDAAKRAQETLGGVRGVNWVKWGALGAGAAALVVATGGLALAAGAGLAGAAVVTSALASFGPGGMIGGLLTAGTLVGAGGGGIAFGLASSGTSAETVEAVVGRQLAAEILRQGQHLEPNPAVWRNLVETELVVRREHERLDEFSDGSALGLQELKRKIQAVERALKYLSDHGLEPGVSRDTEEGSG